MIYNGLYMATIKIRFMIAYNAGIKIIPCLVTWRLQDEACIMPLAVIRY